MKKIVKVGAILCLSTLTSLALAAQTGGYVGAGLGASKLQTPNTDLNDPNFKNQQSHSIGGVGERVFAGYNFNKYVGMEAGLTHYASSNYKATGTTQRSLEYTLNAVNLVGKAYLPISESGFNVYALGGAAYVKSKVESKSGAYQGDNFAYTTNKLRPMYGVGASYDIPQTSLTTNLELSRIQNSSNLKTNPHATPSADVLSLNLGYNFG